MSELLNKPQPADAAVALRVVAILSLLGDGATANPATRVFHGKPVLARTLAAVKQSNRLNDTIILAWDDQLAAIRHAAPDCSLRSLGPRAPSRTMLEAAAALRWSDGWRGALLGKTTFDRGFDANAILAAMDAAECDAGLLIDPAAALIESTTLDSLVDHLAALPDQPYAFTPGAVGSGAMLLRRRAIADLAKQQRGPGSLTAYHPDRPEHDPMAKSFALVVPPRVARATVKLTVDSARQERRLSLAQADRIETTISRLEADRSLDALPREVVIELTCRRATKPAWSMLSKQEIARPDLSLSQAKVIFEQLAEAEDVRVTFSGVGDPLLHPQWRAIVAAAKAAGLNALHLETDLLADSADAARDLAASELDIVSFHLPAAHAVTYARLMGVDRMRDVLEHVKTFLIARNERQSGVPILVPTFIKCADNLAEMEAWYDQWIRAVGAAVIAGPSDFSGRLAYTGLADMTAGRRRPCRRLDSRLTILSDGSIASCEEDALGEQSCGSANAIERAWTGGFAMLRSLHEEHRWDESELCKACRMWDRP